MANKDNISDELLAAYLEGSTNIDETTQVLNALRKNPELRNALDISIQLDEEEPLLQMAAEGGRNLCDVQCEAYILNKKGIDCNVEELLEIAKDNHWIRKAGTPLYCIGNLIEYMGLKVTRRYQASIEELQDLLKKGNGIIVAVDCDKLYPERPDEEDATNHAIVVTRIDGEYVTIYDPENSSEVNIKLPLFMSAWKESKYYLVCETNK